MSGVLVMSAVLGPAGVLYVRRCVVMRLRVIHLLEAMYHSERSEKPCTDASEPLSPVRY
jgi:hypothetical protein